ncbi:hypothetical protein NLJ89_g8804 [Agrocybe chaxingu]|uniref:Uncharacterized protein n=1 Tax=Agrocybe chaxingu TaxID=84603 RepID=A0A9W8JWW9_9AGAR|nr:hypothetical protein NLJ89_g8804 [Agrocybe chaxingu]
MALGNTTNLFNSAAPIHATNHAGTPTSHLRSDSTNRQPFKRAPNSFVSISGAPGSIVDTPNACPSPNGACQASKSSFSHHRLLDIDADNATRFNQPSTRNLGLLCGVASEYQDLENPKISRMDAIEVEAVKQLTRWRFVQGLRARCALGGNMGDTQPSSNDSDPSRETAEGKYLKAWVHVSTEKEEDEISDDEPANELSPKEGPAHILLTSY